MDVGEGVGAGAAERLFVVAVGRLFCCASTRKTARVCRRRRLSPLIGGSCGSSMRRSSSQRRGYNEKIKGEYVQSG
jgi:hypothetical protein